MLGIGIRKLGFVEIHVGLQFDMIHVNCTNLTCFLVCMFELKINGLLS